MNSKIIDKQRAIYQKQFLSCGDTPDATYNQNNSIQELRFARLLDSIDLSESVTIHDLGCGLCDLYPYINARFPNVSYSGTEIVYEMGDLAAGKFPEIEIYIRDVLNDEVLDRYDYTVLSGVFNLPGESSRENWREFTRMLLMKMFEMSYRGISFNFLNASAVDYFHPEMFYEHPQDLAEFCNSNLSRFILIDQTYPLFECTVTVLKPDYIRTIYNDQEFDRFIK